MKRSILILIALSVTLLIGSCCSCRKGSPVIGNLESNAWKLVEINDNTPNALITITFDKYSKVLKGNSENCKIFAGYHLFEDETNNIEFLNPGSSGDKCEDIIALVEILKQTNTVKVDSHHLLMVDKDGSIKAVFSEVN